MEKVLDFLAKKAYKQKAIDNQHLYSTGMPVYLYFVSGKSAGSILSGSCSHAWDSLLRPGN